MRIRLSGSHWILVCAASLILLVGLAGWLSPSRQTVAMWTIVLSVATAFLCWGILVLRGDGTLSTTLPPGDVQSVRWRTWTAVIYFAVGVVLIFIALPKVQAASVNDPTITPKQVFEVEDRARQ